MKRCIALGKNGLGNTAPNPMVGALLVHKGKIISEGFTSPFGGPHAEVNAISKVKDTTILSEATLYVTLEPCSHYGKTPPCADLIIKHSIPKVVIGLLDPHEKVAGKGIQKLRDAGCEVLVGVLEEECKEHHKRFLAYHNQKRPYIILKWAQTLDGFIAPDPSVRASSPEPFWITNSYSKQLVHKWRSEEQAILVGTATALQDNPKLNTRNYKGKSPVRVVIDKNLKIGSDYHLMDGSQKTIVLTQQQSSKEYVNGVHYEVIDFSKNVAQQITDVLYKHHITSIIIEGGTTTIATFTETNLWDEARVFTGPTLFKTGIKAPALKGNLISSITIKNDLLNLYRND